MDLCKSNIKEALRASLMKQTTPLAVTHAVWINNWFYCRAQKGLQDPGPQENRFVQGALFVPGIQPAIPSGRWFCTDVDSGVWGGKLQFTSIGQILLPGSNWLRLVWIVGFSIHVLGFCWCGSLYLLVIEQGLIPNTDKAWGDVPDLQDMRCWTHFCEASVLPDWSSCIGGGFGGSLWSHIPWQKRRCCDTAGSKWLGGWGGPGSLSFLNGEKLRGKKSSFILLIQFPAGRSG